MGLTPHAHIIWWPANESHGHLVPMGDGRVCVLDTEEAAEELAEAMMRCEKDRHHGHGSKHSQSDVEDAYKNAIYQINNIDFESEHMTREWIKMVNKKGGGQAPAAVIYPSYDDPKKWNALLPDMKTGEPVQYDVKKGVMEDIGVRPPQEAGALPDREGVGWKTDRRRKGYRDRHPGERGVRKP